MVTGMVIQVWIGKNKRKTMKQYSLPKPVGQMMSLLPSWPGSVLFVSVLNPILKDKLPEDVTEFMLGKQFRIAVTDAGVNFNFVWTKGGFVPGWGNTEPDLTISASAQDFYLLSKREEDPDTLFFSRRLVMEGDTELGLMIKNTLDSLELNVFELVKSLPILKLLSTIPGFRKS